ncbi:MAG: hypothetical protein R3A80_06890 [Bdellovibrionota bacterium]
MKKNPASLAFHKIPTTREEIKSTIEKSCIPSLYWILSGKAGSGKTLVMENIASAECYPLHSSRLIDKNICTQLLFESLLAKELCQQPLRFLVEDKGRKVAHLSIPDKLLGAWNKAPHFVVETPLETRVENIYQAHVAHQAEDKAQLVYLEQNQERLGRELYHKLRKLCEAATFEKDAELHKEWIRLLIIEHLDPVFEYYFQHKRASVLFSGSIDEVSLYLKNEIDILKTSAANPEKKNTSGSSKQKSQESKV